MDNYIASNGTMAEANTALGTKNKMARELLSAFVSKRPNDRFALTTFSTGVMSVAPFTDHNDAVLAGLEAASVGRGLPHTDLGGRATDGGGRVSRASLLGQSRHSARLGRRRRNWMK